MKPEQLADGVWLYEGDCLEVLPMLAPGCVDAVITSPPYNAGIEYGEHNDAMPLPVYWSWLESVVAYSVRVLAPHGYLCLNHANYIGSREGRVYVPDEIRPMVDRHLPFLDHIIWNKGPANGAAWGNYQTSPRMRAQHENIFVHGGLSQMPKSDITWEDWSRFTTSIWNVPTKGVDLSFHPAMMPIEIPRRLALLYTPACGAILDPFAGSGTTAIAAMQEGRKCILIEKDPRYCDIIRERVRKFDGRESGSLFAGTVPTLFDTQPAL